LRALPLRDLAVWILAAVAAILATAGAFLMLANLATRPAEPGAADGIDAPQAAAERRYPGDDAVVVVEVDEGGLENLRPAPDQRLTLRARNAGTEALPGLSLQAAVVPAGSPPGSEPRTYTQEVSAVSPGGSVERRFEVDLSPIEPEGGAPVPTEERAYLEVRATPSGGGASSIKTVVLATT